MQEEINKKISQFLDDELDHLQTLSLLQTVRQDQRFTNKLNRYRVVSQALKSEKSLLVNVDLIDRVQNQIKQEPVHFLPPKRSPIKWQKASLAIAASLAVIAVLVPKMFNHSALDNGNNIVVAQQEVKVDEQSQQQYIRVKQLSANSRLNEYLQAHSNSVYTVGASNYQPYARVTGYSQGR